MTKKKPAQALGKGAHKEVTATSCRKLLMRASPFFINDEEVMVSVNHKGYATFLVHMLSTYMAELFNSIRKNTHKMDYYLDWLTTAGYYCQLLGIDKEFLKLLVDDYRKYTMKDKDEDVLPDLPNRKAKRKNEAD